MAMRMLGRPTSRYSSRVLKTAPSQWVCGMTHKVGFLAVTGSSAIEATASARWQQVTNRTGRRHMERAPSRGGLLLTTRGRDTECNAQLGRRLDSGVEPQGSAVPCVAFGLEGPTRQRDVRVPFRHAREL